MMKIIVTDKESKLAEGKRMCCLTIYCGMRIWDGGFKKQALSHSAIRNPHSAILFNLLMTFLAIVRAGYFAFEVWASFNRRVVTGIAVPVVREFVVDLGRRGLAFVSHARQLFTIVARL
jgi:hypothetical protein